MSRSAEADAEALIRDHGATAYREARERERDAILPEQHDARWVGTSLRAS
jgi:hypothetical protein